MEILKYSIYNLGSIGKCRINFAIWIRKMDPTTGKSWSSKKEILNNIWLFLKGDWPNIIIKKFNLSISNNLLQNRRCTTDYKKFIYLKYTKNIKISNFGRN